MKKALVFYKGRPPKGTKTDWVMHEYRLLDDKSSSSLQKPKSSMRVRNRIIYLHFSQVFTSPIFLLSLTFCVHLCQLDDWVLCRVRHKGSIPNETDEKQETSWSTDPSVSLISKEHKILRERSESINEWSDSQLLDYLLSSRDEGGESKAEVLYSPESFSQETMGSCGYAADSTQSSQLVSSMLNSIKRTLSFGVLDELMLQPQSERLHFTTNICEQQSPSSSFSVAQLCSEFII